MSIVIIKGQAKSGKTLIANALRNNQISSKKGALLIDETNDGEAKPLLEKILIGVPLPAEIPADWATKLPWKPDAMIIVVAEKQKMLDQFEAVLPGFKEKFGPVYTVKTGIMP
jgi:hypothetical protein